METVTIIIALIVAAALLLPRVIAGLQKKDGPQCGGSCASCGGQEPRDAADESGREAND